MATVNENVKSVVVNTNSEDFSFTYDDREITPIERLPQVYKSIYDFRGLCNASGVELADLYKHVHAILEDQFIASASSDTLAKWEKHLSITPKGTDTIEERRFRILTNLNDSPPYTDKYLVNRLTELCGANNFSIAEFYDQYKLLICLSTDSPTNTETIYEFVKSIIPANIELEILPFRALHSELHGKTHEYLSGYTHNGIAKRESL